jgi:hypothetical protein
MNIKKIISLSFFLFVVNITLYSQIHSLKESSFIFPNFDKNKHIKNESPIYFEVENKKLQSGRIILNLSTLSQENIRLSWKSYTLKSSNVRWAATLQYRLSENDDWKNVLDENKKPITFNTTKRPKTKTFEYVLLPQECENKEHIQLSWKLSKIRGSGANPSIQIKDILVESENDPYNGVEANLSIELIKGNKKVLIDKIFFNHIPMPYVYPETMRMELSGKYIRNDVKLEIRGKDKDYFKLSSKTLDIKESSQTFSISYIPKKIGEHSAELVLSTNKLANPIVIPLTASCSSISESEFIENKIQEISLPTIDREISFSFPVFSNRDYQFTLKLTEEELSLEESNEKKYTGIRITYKWYRKDKLICEMDDEVTNLNYCVPLQSPLTADKLEINIHNIERLEIKDLYFGYPKIKRLISSGYWSNPEIWEPQGEPTMEDFVYINSGCNVIVDCDAMCSMLFLGDSVNVEIETDRMFYVSGDIMYGNMSYFTVHQNLDGEKWNYLTSPMNKTQAAVFSMERNNNDTWLMQYNTGKKSKHGDYWSEYLTDPNFILLPGKGYAVYTQSPLDIKYEGILCNSSTIFTLIENNYDKKNLVGNPFTAPLSSKKIFEAIDGKIQGNAIFLMDKKNKVYNPIIVDPNENVLIPSLEAFFVETISDKSEIIFKRQHQYIPKSGEQSFINNNYLTLSAVVDGVSQYALLGMKDNSKYEFDKYDAHKIFGTSETMAEIYFIADGEELSVNIFPDYPASFDVGLFIAQGNEIELQLNNISVLPKNVLVLLEDKDNQVFYNLCDSASVKTQIASGTTNSRYRIHLIKAKAIYDLHPDYSGIYIWEDDERILIYGDGIHKLQKVKIWDKDHLYVDEQEYNSEIIVFEDKITSGRYSIDLQVEDQWIEHYPIEVK